MRSSLAKEAYKCHSNCLNFFNLSTNILNELLEKFGVKSDYTVHFEVLLEAFVLQQETCLPRLISFLFRDSKVDTYLPIAKLLNRINISEFYSYKNQESIKKAPSLSDSLTEKLSFEVLEDIVLSLPQFSTGGKEKLAKDHFMFLDALVHFDWTWIIKMLVRDYTSTSGLKKLFESITPKHVEDFSKNFEFIRGILVFSCEDPLPKDTDEDSIVSKETIGNIISGVMKEFNKANNFYQTNSNLDSAILGMTLNNFSTILQTLSSCKNKEAYEGLLMLASLFEPTYAKSLKKVEFYQIITFLFSFLEEDNIKLKHLASGSVAELKKSISPKANQFASKKSGYCEQMLRDIDHAVKEKKLFTDSLDYVLMLEALFRAEFGTMFISNIENEELRNMVEMVMSYAIKLQRSISEGKFEKKNFDEHFMKFFELIAKKIDDENARDIFMKVIKVVDIVLNLLTTQRWDWRDFKKVIAIILKEFIDHLKEEKMKELLYDIGSLICCLDFKNIDISDKENVKIDSMKFEDVINVLFDNVIPIILPKLKEFLDSEKINRVFTILKSFKGDNKNALVEQASRRCIIETIIEEGKELQIVNKDLASLLEKITESHQALESGNYSEFMDSYIDLLPIPEAARSNAKDIYEKGLEILNQKALKAAVTEILRGSKKTPEDQDEWKEIAAKIKSGEAKKDHLYMIIQKESGSESTGISQDQFKLLATRLNFKLSDHRVSEIFAKVKKESGQNENSYSQLNKEEFEKALDYLGEKSLRQAMLMLGINPERLAFILISLTILLILILVFIYFGIIAFAYGGSFGAFINSCFPPAAGLGLGKKSSRDKKLLESENVAEKTDKAVKIMQSEV